MSQGSQHDWDVQFLDLPQTCMTLVKSHSNSVPVLQNRDANASFLIYI